MEEIILSRVQIIISFVCLHELRAKPNILFPVIGAMFLTLTTVEVPFMAMIMRSAIN